MSYFVVQKIKFVLRRVAATCTNLVQGVKSTKAVFPLSKIQIDYVKKSPQNESIKREETILIK